MHEFFWHNRLVQEFFSYEVMHLQDIFFKITHLPPQKLNSRPLIKKEVWCAYRSEGGGTTRMFFFYPSVWPILGGGGGGGGDIKISYHFFSILLSKIK